MVTPRRGNTAVMTKNVAYQPVRVTSRRLSASIPFSVPCRYGGQRDPSRLSQLLRKSSGPMLPRLGRVILTGAIGRCTVLTLTCGPRLARGGHCRPAVAVACLSRSPKSSPPQVAPPSRTSGGAASGYGP